MLSMATRLQRLFVSLLCLLLAGNICAQADHSSYRTYAGRLPRHYLGISLGGGEANNITDTVKHLGGAGAGIGLHYEVQYRSWIFGISLEAQYQYLRDRLQNPFTDTEDALRVYDIIEPGWPVFQDSIAYKYEYSDYLETGHHGSVAFSVYGGKEFSNAMYLLLGVKVTMPVLTSYRANATLRTSARYSWAIEDLRDLGLFQEDELHDYGVFDEHTYQKPTLSYSDYIRIAPFVEWGYNIPLPADKTKMRVGVYGTYGFRLGENPKNPLANYDKVKREWGRNIQSTQMLQETIQWTPLAHSDRYASLPHNLEIGAKLTILFDVTMQKQICHCVK